MDTNELAEEFVAMCFGRSGDVLAGGESREVATDIGDGRQMVIAVNPRIDTASIALELNLTGIDRPAEGELEWALLQSTWDDRLANGFVAAREESGKDMIAVATHRATANAHALSATLAALFRIAEKPGAAPVVDTVTDQADMVWLRV